MSTTNLLPLPLHRFAHIEAYNPEAQLVGKQRSAVLLIAAFLVLAIGGGIFVPIGGAVIGSGQVGTESQTRRISHPLGGTISQILVENGQHVRKGQVLIRLDDKVSGADANFAALTVDQMVAQKARLEAEQIGAKAVVFPDLLTKRRDPAAMKAMADERRMFEIRRSEQAGIMAQLTARIGQYREQIDGYRAQIASLRQQGALIEPERKGVAELYAKKLVTLSRLNQLERTAVDLKGSAGALISQIAAAEAQISETREQMIQTTQTRRSEAGTQIAQINSQLNQQQVRSMAAMDAHDRTLIRAPYDGVVAKLAFSTIGGVIRPAEEIMEVVPDRDQSMVEGEISPSDVDQVHQGQKARIRFSSLNSGATPELTGTLVYVGADRTTDPDGKRSYFPVRVAIDARSLSENKDVVLKPGMPAELFVETGSRSMLSYLTKPLRDQFARAFRDN